LNQRAPVWTYIVLLLVFLFRLFFGFFANMEVEDQKQIYLIGLKYYCTGQWPYFGPDVIDQSRPDFPNIQIPGALQGLVVGIPLRVWPVPEAPFVAVNLLSFLALCLFAWYCSRRLPTFPRWLLWGWVLTAPWVLNSSTNIYNPSYLLFGSILFFIGFLETIPSLKIAAIPAWLGNLMMGFGFFWNAQFHMSFVILVPYLVVSAYYQLQRGWMRNLFFFLMGALGSGAFLIPTLWTYGMQGLGGTGSTMGLHVSNLTSFFTVLAQYLSLASAEVPRFIGRNNDMRLQFLRSKPWAAPFTVITLVIGIVQPLIMLASLFRRQHDQEDWAAVKVLAFSTFLLIFASFLFSVKSPTSYTFYIALPVAMLYLFYTFSPWSSRRWFVWLAGLLLFSNIVFHLGLAAYNYRERSFFAYRASIVRAIDSKDYHQLGERRHGARY
jgi:hypothetical protein